MKKKADIQKTSVISKSPTNLEILNPDDYSAYDINMKEEYKNFNIGDEIKVIKINEEFYPLIEKKWWWKIINKFNINKLVNTKLVKLIKLVKLVKY